ncbi:MAG: NAD-dependent malic enzyme [Planctomycetes bacterium]|nr:NAD-dependent malic enzyme [Planctomycetota bacterium]
MPVTRNVIGPGLALCRDTISRARWIETSLSGAELESAPVLNKGTGFTQEERDAFGLTGLLPPRCVTMDEQKQRIMSNYRVQRSDLERYAALVALSDRNETLFYKVLLDHFDEMLPIVYTPTVGEACRQFGRLYRRGRGLYFTPETAHRMDELMGRWPWDDVRVIVVTDGERVLGLGDLGAGGMGISIGKISLYVGAGGIHPARTLPVCLDVGTNNDALLSDSLYLGRQSRRVRGAEYDALVEAFILGVQRRWPKAMIQFEDFATPNALAILERWKDRACCFNDDIQGTGAVTLAGVLAGLRITGARLEDQRVLIVGAGSAGVGIGRALGRGPGGASIRMIDVNGLITASRTDITKEQREFAADEPGGALPDVARRFRPTVLIGVTGQRGAFTREVIEAMDGERPMIFPLSNPTSCCECTPDDARAWTGGRAIVATGSPFPGTAQCNNVYVFPGIGLGVIAAEATRVTDGMVRAAAEALASLAQGERLFPPLRDIRAASSVVAHAVARRAADDGAAPPADDATLRRRIADAVWEPEYVPYRRPEG